MPNHVTVASSNRYCKSRLKAAEFNQKLQARSTAILELPGVSEDSLKKYELGINRPPNTVVAMMADAYCDPELRSWYCATECPLGKDRICEIEDMPPERSILRMQHNLQKVQDAITEFSQIVEDGKVDQEEMQRIPGLEKQFKDARARVDEALAALEKIQKRKGYAK
jgi:hypothetical protein